METNQTAAVPVEGHLARTWSGQAIRLTINQKEYTSLLNFVDEMLAMQGCDNTLDHAATWARAHGIDWARLSRSLRSLGGFCDCELGMNTVSYDNDENEDD